MRNYLQIIFASALGALAAYCKILIVPLVVLIAVMLIDYFTGMAAASYNHELNSRVGVLGLLKKVGYLALVAVGMAVDYLISYALVQVGIDAHISLCFGMIVTVWLIINELISILENLGELNIPLPQFLIKTIKTLRGRVENEAEGKHFKEDGEDD